MLRPSVREEPGIAEQNRPAERRDLRILDEEAPLFPNGAVDFMDPEEDAIGAVGQG
jgi:hypothetical protein